MEFTLLRINFRVTLSVHILRIVSVSHSCGRLFGVKMLDNFAEKWHVNYKNGWQKDDSVQTNHTFDGFFKETSSFLDPMFNTVCDVSGRSICEQHNIRCLRNLELMHVCPIVFGRQPTDHTDMCHSVPPVGNAHLHYAVLHALWVSSFRVIRTHPWTEECSCRSIFRFLSIEPWPAEFTWLRNGTKLVEL